MTAHSALVAQLSSEGIGTPGVTLFDANMTSFPEGEGPFVSLLAYPGPNPIGTHNVGPTDYRRPAFQCVVRGNNVAAVKTKVFQAYDALTLVNVELSGIWFLNVTPQQEPFELPSDGKSRARWAFNVATLHKGVSA